MKVFSEYIYTYNTLVCVYEKEGWKVVVSPHGPWKPWWGCYYPNKPWPVLMGRDEGI
jgi:hypothetical protein